MTARNPEDIDRLFAEGLADASTGQTGKRDRSDP